jgi:hypothetical protein
MRAEWAIANSGNQPAATLRVLGNHAEHLEANMDQIGKRFQHDMELGGLAERTQTHYLDAIRDYGKHFGRSPAELGHEELRVWSKHLLDSGVGDGRLRQHFAALKFLYKKTLAQPEAVAFLSFRGKTGPLLDILSAAEVERTLAAVRRPRFRMLFTTMYATGLRLKEARHLETSDPARWRSPCRQPSSPIARVLAIHCRFWWTAFPARPLGSQRLGSNHAPGPRPFELHEAIVTSMTSKSFDPAKTQRDASHELRNLGCRLGHGSDF